jgi:HEAT repeat protein
MWPFRKLDIERLTAEGDVKGLVKALGHRKRSVRDAAAAALAEFEDDPEVQAILSELRDNPSRAELQRRLSRITDQMMDRSRLDQYGSFR